MAKINRRFFSILSMILLGLPLGCGGGDDSAQLAPPPSAPPSPPPTVPRAPVSRVAPKRSRPESNRTRKSAKKKTSSSASEIPDPRSFLVGTDYPNVMLSTDRLPPDRADYALLPPPAGQNSTHMLIVPPLRESAAASPSDVQLPKGFRVVEDAGIHATGMPLRIRCEKDGSVMAFVPSGVYTRGVDDGPPNAAPAHPVFVSAFYMDIHETTLEQYDAFRNELGRSRVHEASNANDPPTHPVLGVNWRDVLHYAQWSGKEIPREAEWEYAARGPKSFPYVWGYGRPLWSKPRSPGQVSPVGSFRNDTSLFGIQDLAGNAREWCADWYLEDAYQKDRTPDGSPIRNPSGPDRPPRGRRRVVRGAGAQGWEVWYRDGETMSTSRPDIGMRFVLRLSLPQENENTETDDDSRPNF